MKVLKQQTMLLEIPNQHHKFVPFFPGSNFHNLAGKCYFLMQERHFTSSTPFILKLFVIIIALYSTFLPQINHKFLFINSAINSALATLFFLIINDH